MCERDLRRGIREAAILGVCAALAGCAAGAPESASAPLRAADPAADEAEAGSGPWRYTDLLRLTEHFQGVVEGRRATVGVWDLAEHHRPVLEQRSPSRIVLGPVPAGERCRVRFGLARRDAEGADGAPVRARLVLLRAGERRIAFEEVLAAAESGGETWRDREVALGGGAEFSLELETRGLGAEAGGRASRVGWAAPHVLCEVPPVPPRPLPRPHVILVSIDTLRPDHLGAYGYDGRTSPTLDRLADDAVVFHNAFAPAPWTLPSHATMFTGLFPHEHGAGHLSPFDPLGDRVPTLAESLRDAGYWTIAFTAGGIMSQRYGLARGFQWWTQRGRANLADMLPGVFDALGTSPRRPLFLVLHTYDVHGPYGYLPEVERFAGPAPEPGVPEAEWGRALGIGYHRYQKLDRFEGLAGAVAAYDAGIRFVDAQLRVLFRRLREIGAFEEALIIVTSDHGESLYDRGLYIGHSYSLHDEEVRIPLIVRLPRSRRPEALRGARRSDELVELVDLAPLILDVAGVEHGIRFSGSNPLRRIAGLEPRREWVRGEAAHTGSRYAQGRGWKLITAPYAAGDERSRLPAGLRDRFPFGEQLFDLARDPRAQRNLAGTTGDGASEIGEKANEIRELIATRASPGAPPGPAPGLTQTEVEQLRALGYLPAPD